ncbi:hypothetical protein BS78_K178700 [Paspalum vaginatum]|uniref:Late embryogenesis abundant protein LEA-2 subgroup domain-containing protein n=1 Tax=Paspalum vaginatum TaxID=158149 RepID=A0A9W7XB01_9POAL|nr:hypothetical protein BS78_K178700 [Paspalum vaginatum]
MNASSQQFSCIFSEEKTNAMRGFDHTRWRRTATKEACPDECFCCCCLCCFSGKSLENFGFWSVCCFVYSIIEFVAPITLLSLLFWLLLRPNNLRPVVDSAALVRFSINNVTSTLDYGLTIDLSIHNSHKYFDIRYFDLTAVASYGGTRLGPSVDVLPIFVQRPRATNLVHAAFHGSTAPLDPAAAKLFTREVTNSSFNLLVTVASTFMFKVRLAPVYYYNHECYISFPAPYDGGRPGATLLTLGTRCIATAR